MTKKIARCKWAEGVSLAYIEYHDEEWGVPVYDDRVQFEFLLLEGAQAGLSWSTILNKREGYRKAFADFDVEKVARFTQKRVEKLREEHRATLAAVDERVRGTIGRMRDDNARLRSQLAASQEREGALSRVLSDQAARLLSEA